MWLQKIKRFALVPVLLMGISLFGQDQNVQQLISEGIALHDEGKYDEAIARYRSALILQPRFFACQLRNGVFLFPAAEV